jgi:hypothetical protein
VRSTNTVSLHSKEIIISAVVFTSADGVSTHLIDGDARIVYDSPQVESKNSVTFTFASALPVGAGRITIEYTGILNGDMAGKVAVRCPFAFGGATAFI